MITMKIQDDHGAEFEIEWYIGDDPMPIIPFQYIKEIKADGEEAILIAKTHMFPHSQYIEE